MNALHTIKTALSVALLAGLSAAGSAAAADAGTAPIVYGGFTASNGVTLPVDVSAYGSAKQGVTAATAGSRVFGVFERDPAGVTVVPAAVAGTPAQASLAAVTADAATDLVYGGYRSIDGVMLPASRDRTSTAIELADAAIAARDAR